MKRFTPRTSQRAKGDRTTLCGLHFAVVSDKLDLSSTERRLDKENIIFIVSINQCTRLKRFVRIVHSFNFHLLRGLSTFLCFFRGVSEEHFMPC